MKKAFLTTIVVALFATGFTASGDSEDVRYENGVKYHKVTVKCAECGVSLDYWESESGGAWINKPNTWHGDYYCGTHYSYHKDMEGVAGEAAKKFGGGW